MGIFGDKSYAQHGEDFMILNLIDILGLSNPRWLDLGAHMPEVDSNTKLLYERGWRGINVEANPNLIQAFRERRPEDINVNVGVGLDHGSQPFYMVDERSGLNSFCKKEIERSGRPIVKTIDVEMMGAYDIVGKYCDYKWPEILFTDLEGLDYDVLKSCLFEDGNRPRIICSEIRGYDGMRAKLMMQNKGYSVLCRLTANLIFLDAIDLLNCIK